jgi:thioredoxin-related protein
MKKIIWFVKENGKQVEKSISEIISLTSTHKSLKITEYDIDNEMFMAQDYKVRSVPTMVLVDDKGVEIRRQIGLVTEEKLLEFLKG